MKGCEKSFAKNMQKIQVCAGGVKMGRLFELDLEFVSQPRGAVSTLRNVKLLKKCTGRLQ